MSDSELAALVHVQDLDLRADQLLHRRAHLPERASRAGLEAEVATARADQERRVTRHRELVTARDAGEATTVANARQRQQLDRKLASASTAREADALGAELAALAARQAALDDAVFEALVELEELDETIAARAASLDELTARVDDARAGEATAVAVIDAELAGLAADRAQAVAGVGQALLKRYEALRTRLGGIGLARVVDRRCSGCNLLLPSAELEELRRLGDRDVGECSQCGRMLAAG